MGTEFFDQQVNAMKVKTKVRAGRPNGCIYVVAKPTLVPTLSVARVAIA